MSGVERQIGVGTGRQKNLEDQEGITIPQEEAEKKPKKIDLKDAFTKSAKQYDSLKEMPTTSLSTRVAVPLKGTVDRGNVKDYDSFMQWMEDNEKSNIDNVQKFAAAHKKDNIIGNTKIAAFAIGAIVAVTIGLLIAFPPLAVAPAITAALLAIAGAAGGISFAAFLSLIPDETTYEENLKNLITAKTQATVGDLLKDVFNASEFKDNSDINFSELAKTVQEVMHDPKHLNRVNKIIQYANEKSSKVFSKNDYLALMDTSPKAIKIKDKVIHESLQGVDELMNALFSDILENTEDTNTHNILNSVIEKSKSKDGVSNYIARALLFSGLGKARRDQNSQELADNYFTTSKRLITESLERKLNSTNESKPDEEVQGMEPDVGADDDGSGYVTRL